MFAGPFSGSTARAVASVGEASRFDALLDELTHASLVTVDTSGSETRYRLLETVRQFALDRLRRRGALESTYDRFADHVVASVRRDRSRGATRTWRPGLLHDLVAAFDDLAEALRWCTAHDDDPRRAYSLCASLWAIVHQGRADDIAELVRRTLARWPDRESPASAQCVAALATAEYVTGHPERALDLVDVHLAALGSARPGVGRRCAGRGRGPTGGRRHRGCPRRLPRGRPRWAYELEDAVDGDGARDRRRRGLGRPRGDVTSSVDALGEIVERAAASGSVITESWARACVGLAAPACRSGHRAAGDRRAA